jgi:hypothetical protein
LQTSTLLKCLQSPYLLLKYSRFVALVVYFVYPVRNRTMHLRGVQTPLLLGLKHLHARSKVNCNMYFTGDIRHYCSTFRLHEETKQQ